MSLFHSDVYEKLAVVMFVMYQCTQFPVTVQVVTLPEAKLLLKEDDDLIITVFDYWLNKRLKFAVSLSGHIVYSWFKIYFDNYG